MKLNLIWTPLVICPLIVALMFALGSYLSGNLGTIGFIAYMSLGLGVYMGVFAIVILRSAKIEWHITMGRDGFTHEWTDPGLKKSINDER